MTAVRLPGLVPLLLAACTTPEGMRAITRDEPTPLGVTAAEVVAKAEGKRSGTLTWTTLPAPGLPEGFTLPVSGSTPVFVTVSCDGGQSRLHATINQDLVEVDCRAAVTTSDGGLRETLSGKVLAYNQSPGEQAVHGPYFDTEWVRGTELAGTVKESLQGSQWAWFSLGLVDPEKVSGEIRWGQGKLEDDGSGNWGGATSLTPIATLAP